MNSTSGNNRQESLNAIAMDKLLQNAAKASIEIDQRGLSGDDAMAFFIDSQFKVIQQLMNENAATIDEAVDAFISSGAAGESANRQWIKDLILGNI